MLGWQDALVIGSRLDADAGAQLCRLALAGRLVALLEANPAQLARLRLYKVVPPRILVVLGLAAILRVVLHDPSDSPAPGGAALAHVRGFGPGNYRIVNPSAGAVLQRAGLVIWGTPGCGSRAFCVAHAAHGRPLQAQY